MSLLTNGYCRCQFIIVHFELDNTYEMAILILIIKVKNHFILRYLVVFPADAI